MKTNVVYAGDAHKKGRNIDSNSVDMVFTDPPYPLKYLHLYRWLGRFALRVLKPGGWLFVYGGAQTSPQMVNLLNRPGLEYFWTDVLTHVGAYPRIWYKKLMSGYKPVFIFTKGPFVKETLKWRSTITRNERDKNFHVWGQGAAYPAKIIDMLTPPGGLVVDPFCGGGTTLAAAKGLGRQYVGIDLDPEAVKITLERLAVVEERQMTYMPDVDDNTQDINELLDHYAFVVDTHGQNSPEAAEIRKNLNFILAATLGREHGLADNERGSSADRVEDATPSV